MSLSCNSRDMNESVQTEMDFCTLAMFIIDEIHFRPPKTPIFNIIGGAGTYSSLGARLFCPAPLDSRRIGWIVDCGDDFPDEVKTTIESWQTNVLMRRREGLTTRARNEYGDGEVRRFRYTTPKIRIDAEDLTPPLLRSHSFHFVCSSSRCTSLVQNILQKRTSIQDTCTSPLRRPLLIWEPIPDLCVPEQLGQCKKACKLVDVISPNDNELLTFFGESDAEEDEERWQKVQQRAAELLTDGVGFGMDGAVVIRAGKHGCYLTMFEDGSVAGKWLPAFHQNPSNVVDPTGAGNGFLGGFAIGFLRAGDRTGIQRIEYAATYGLVAASFCIEQVGVPALRLEGKETWNDTDVMDRLVDFRLRCTAEI